MRLPPAFARRVRLPRLRGQSKVVSAKRALNSQGLKQIVPGPPLQARVTDATYGNEGVKAGFATGQCQSNFGAAIDALIAQGVEVVILGCTELPLLLPHADFVSTGGATVRLVDPTDVLARQCVGYATAASASHRT